MEPTVLAKNVVILLTIEVLGIFYEKSLMLSSILHETIFIKVLDGHLIYVIHITKLYKTCSTLLCKNENKSFRRILKCSQGENCVRISDQRFYCTSSPACKGAKHAVLP